MIPYKKQTSSKAFFAPPDRQLKYKLVISYGIFWLIIIVMGIVLYFLTINNMRGNFRQQEQALLNSSVQNMDTALQVADAFSKQLLMEPDYLDAASCQEGGTLDYVTKTQALRTYLATNLYPDMLLPLENYYIYLKESDRIISPYYNTGTSSYYHIIQNYSNNTYELWLKQLNDASCYETFLKNSTFDRQSYLYLIDLKNSFHPQSQGVLALVFNDKKLIDYFPHIAHYEGGYLFALDTEGNIMFSLSQQELYDETGSVRDTQDTMLQAAADLFKLDFHSGYSRFYMNGTAMLVTSASSNVNGWTYYLLRPESVIYSRLYPFQFIYWGILIIAFLLGIYVILTLSRRNVQPLIDLGNELKHVNTEKNLLLETADKQRPIISASYLKQLMSGSISSEDEMSYIRNYLELPEMATVYNVVYIVAYNNLENGFETAAIPETEDFSSILLDSLKQYFGLPLYCYSPEERIYALLLACSDMNAEDLFMHVQETIVKLHDYLLDNYGIWLYAGIGQAAGNLMNVWECYQQAMEAASHSAKNFIFFPYEIMEKNSNAFYYPPELSTKLIHFITTGNKAQVLEVFSLIHQENITERSLPLNLLQYLMQDIRNTLLKARFTLPSDAEGDGLRQLDKRFDEHLSFKLCEDLALSLCDLFQTENKEQSLVSTIEQYIKNNYRDPSLGLNKISDEFQISESYFSHMFKEKSGVNFSVYLEALRMREAARLIQNTNINLSELYIEVGYNNPATFRRAFKKIYGITPSAMRENATKH